MADQSSLTLEQALEAHYPEEVLRSFEAQTANAAEIARQAIDPERLKQLVDDVSGAHQALIVLELLEGGQRGEQIRREGILMGLGDVEEGLRRLIAASLLVMVPAPGQRNWELEDELQTRRYLQREIIFPADVAAFVAAHLDLTPEQFAIGSSGHDVSARSPYRLESFEYDLLHLSSLLNGDALLLNKDGTPNRRSLSRFTRELFDAALEPIDEERLHHLMAFGLSLGVLKQDTRRVTTDVEGSTAFFSADTPERDRMLVKAYRNNPYLIERLALERLKASREGDVLAENRRLGALVESEQGALLAGPRGQLLSDLRQIELRGWAEVESLVQMLRALDRGYLERTLSEGGSSGVDAFLRAALTIGMAWMGITETGTITRRGALVEVVRFTPRGAHLLRIDGAEPPQVPPFVPALLVQPNFEVTVYLAEASLHTLHTLYQVSVRVRIADRIGVFLLSAESVQKGYGQGAEAEAIVSFLTENSRVPLPESVAFALRDWERVQRKITLFASGTLLTYPDPDRLDIIAGTLQHFWQHDEPPQVLGSTELFLPVHDQRAIEKAVDIESAHIVDYDAPPPPCLQHVPGPHAAPPTFAPLTTGLDFITQVELEAIAEPEGPADFATAWRIDFDRVVKRWGDGATEALLEFLDLRLVEGVPPELEIPIRARMTRSLSATVDTGVTLVTLSSAELTDLVLEIHDADELVEARLGPVTLRIVEGGAEAFEALLERLGLA